MFKSIILYKTQGDFAVTERVEAEVVVAGGGPGGICAALAAARLGKKTVLATDRPVLGGNSSSEIRVWTRGATGAGNLYGEEMGVWGELKLRCSGTTCSWNRSCRSPI